MKREKQDQPKPNRTNLNNNRFQNIAKVILVIKQKQYLTLLASKDPDDQKKLEEKQKREEEIKAFVENPSYKLMKLQETSLTLKRIAVEAEKVFGTTKGTNKQHIKKQREYITTTTNIPIASNIKNRNNNIASPNTILRILDCCSYLATTITITTTMLLLLLLLLLLPLLLHYYYYYYYYFSLAGAIHRELCGGGQDTQCQDRSHLSHHRQIVPGSEGSGGGHPQDFDKHQCAPSRSRHSSHNGGHILQHQDRHRWWCWGSQAQEDCIYYGVSCGYLLSLLAFALMLHLLSPLAFALVLHLLSLLAFALASCICFREKPFEANWPQRGDRSGRENTSLRKRSGDGWGHELTMDVRCHGLSWIA